MLSNVVSLWFPTVDHWFLGMGPNPTSNDYLGNSLHNHPASYWCPDCHRFALDCGHLVEPLNALSVILSNWLIQSVTYDGAQRIVE